jgi:hypothetical protein
VRDSVVLLMQEAAVLGLRACEDPSSGSSWLLALSMYHGKARPHYRFTVSDAGNSTDKVMMPFTAGGGSEVVPSGGGS